MGVADTAGGAAAAPAPTPCPASVLAGAVVSPASFVGDTALAAGPSLVPMAAAACMPVGGLGGGVAASWETDAATTPPSRPGGANATATTTLWGPGIAGHAGRTMPPRNRHAGRRRRRGRRVGARCRPSRTAIAAGLGEPLAAGEAGFALASTMSGITAAAFPSGVAFVGTAMGIVGCAPVCAVAIFAIPARTGDISPGAGTGPGPVCGIERRRRIATPQKTANCRPDPTPPPCRAAIPYLSQRLAWSNLSVPWPHPISPPQSRRGRPSVKSNSRATRQTPLITTAHTHVETFAVARLPQAERRAS